MNRPAEDPLLASTRREALLVLAIWLVACVTTISICYWLGYHRDVATLTFVAGFPDWVFWGLIVPWTVCTALCFVVPRFVIADDDLGEVQDEDTLPTAAGGEADHA